MIRIARKTAAWRTVDTACHTVKTCAKTPDKNCTKNGGVADRRHGLPHREDMRKNTIRAVLND